MIQHVWTILCRLSVVSQETNNVSLIEILEEANIPIPPPANLGPGFVPAVVDVVTLWSRQDDNQPALGSARVLLISPSGIQLNEIVYEVDLREPRRFRHTSRMIGLPAQDEGRYHFRLAYRLQGTDDWVDAGSLPIWINVMRPNERAGGNGRPQVGQ